MKKIYLAIATACLSGMTLAQDAFWTVTNYRGAFPVTDGTPATDWTHGWSNFNPDTVNYSTNYTTTVSSDITTSTTWSGTILLQNKVYVKNNATLTIAPGTVIRGDKNTQGTLIVTRGAKINANGTAAQPIVFTSNQAVGNRAEGDWGGLVILGLARNNQPGGVANIEGLVPTTDTQFGGNFDNDNSGTIRYVRIEFAGIPLEPNKEINGITFGSVGSATTVEYVQVSKSGDDSFEWFGGTVNCKYLIAYRGLDDDFDTDFGYRGKVQFGLSIRDRLLSDAPGDSNCFESDNDATGSTAQPKTAPIFSNITIVGAKGDGTTTLPTGEKFEKAFRLRRNTATSCFNSLVTGWEKGLSIEGAPVVANVNGDTLVFANNILTNFAVPSYSTNNTAAVFNSGGADAAFYNSFWTQKSNDSISTLAQVNWVNMFPALGIKPDARLNNGSIAASGASFLLNKFYSVSMPLIANTSVTYCQGATATALSATASSGNSLRWYTEATGGTASSNAIVPSTTSAGTFTYYVSQANTNGDESKRVAITVTVNANPSVPVITANGPTVFCTGGDVVLSAPSATSYNWSNGSTTQTITVTASGSYTVTVSNAQGCTAASTPQSVNVSSAPAPSITASSLTGCTGETITLTSSTADSYSWSNGGTTQSITVSASGSFTVTTTNQNECDGVGASEAVNITFGTTPTAAGSFSTNGNVVTFTNASTSATAYNWNFGDGTNSSQTNPVHAFAVNGAYTVTLTAINGNCTDTETFTVNITLDVNDIEGVNDIKVYPNPAANLLNVSFDNQLVENVEVTLIDALGRIIEKATAQDFGTNIVSFDLNNVSNGIYNVQLISGSNSTLRKVIVNK